MKELLKVSTEAHYDLILVGGGVLGAFHAYHAVDMGLRVLVLEKDAAPRGATTRNFGQVVPSGMDTTWQRFGRESLEIYRNIQEQFDVSIRQQGSLYIASDDDELRLLEELRDINRDHQYPSELWTPPQCLARYPQLRADYCRGGLFFPEEMSVNPRQMVHGLWNLLEQNPSLDLKFSTCVVQIESSGGTVRARTTSGDTHTADRAMVCNGSDFQLLFPELFRESDLQVVKLQMLRLKPMPDVRMPGNVLTGLSIRRYESFSQCPSWPEIKSRERDDAFWKQWGVHILFKQESDGSIILGDSHEYASAANADSLGFDLRGDIHRYFLDEAQKIFDLPAVDVDAAWAGRYCQTNHPDGIFQQVIDGRIHVVTGIGGKGMTSSAGYSKHNLQQIYNPIQAA